MMLVSSNRVELFCKRPAVLAACLGWALAAGCGRAEPPASEAAKPTENQAKPAVAKADTPAKAETPAKLTARKVLGSMVAAYQKASSYADAGVVHVEAEADGKKLIDDSAKFSVTLARPNQIRLEAYQVKLVSDGKQLFAAIDDLPGQVLEKPAPKVCRSRRSTWIESWAWC